VDIPLLPNAQGVNSLPTVRVALVHGWIYQVFICDADRLVECDAYLPHPIKERSSAALKTGDAML
jgi:hypothetical protein